MQKNSGKYLFFLFVLISSYFIACSPQKSYKVLSFLFDGVPEPSPDKLVELNDTVYQTDSVVIASNRISQPLMFYHSPYKKKECTICHDRNSMDKTVEPQPKLCYKCHDNYNDKFEFIHGPVGGGYCTSCHNAHKSKSDHLLLRSSQQLCIHCHDSILVFKNRYHLNNDISNCIECHNPHGGENRYMPEKGSCYKCHEKYNEKFSYLHGPVAGEYCTTCHSPHMTKTKKLLIMQGSSLCLNCHNKELIFESDHHKNVDKTCIDCHDPHGGEDRLFIKNKTQ
ncbi:MAG: cytochrome c3 family protein [Bacteroidota bacterium]